MIFKYHTNSISGFQKNSFGHMRIMIYSRKPGHAGLVERPEDYLYSSARNYAGMSSLIEIDYI